MSSRYPELPPGYAYVQDNRRIYITYPHHETRTRRHLYLPNTCKHQYWHQHVNAALAAWKHAYKHKGEDR